MGLYFVYGMCIHIYIHTGLGSVVGPNFDYSVVCCHSGPMPINAREILKLQGDNQYSTYSGL